MSARAPAKLAAWGSLVLLTALPPCLHYADAISAEAMKLALAAGTAAWFAAAPLAMRREAEASGS